MKIADSTLSGPADSSDQRSTGSAITRRALAIAFLLVIGFTAAGCFSVFLRYEIIGTGYLPRGAIFLLLALVVGNVALRGLKRFGIRPLNARELLVIFLILMIIAAIAGQEFAQHFYLNIVGITYYATPDIAPPDLYLNELNPLLLPGTDPAGNVVTWAHEGLPAGQDIPWRAWIAPLAVWTPFFLSLYWMILCFGAIIAHRWEAEEKLLYPLMEVPVAVAESEPSSVASIFRNPLFWAMFILPCIHYTLKGLHGYWPIIPFIDLEPRLRQQFTGPLSAFNWLRLHIRFDMIGIAYLLAAEVGFSLWFFLIFRRLQQAFRIGIGITRNHHQFFKYQSVGGFILLAAALLWSARQHIARVIGVAFGTVKRGPDAPDADEPYRLAFFGFLAALTFIVLWGSYFGLSPLWSLIQYGSFPLIVMVTARVISEAGMFIYSIPFQRPNEIRLFEMVGTQNIGPHNIAMLQMMSWCQLRSTATQNMAAVTQGYKLSSRIRARRGKVMLVAIAAIAVAILTCHVTAPYVIYNWSVPKLAQWPSNSALNATRAMARYIETPTSMGGEDWVGVGLGGAMMWALFALRRRYVWWPLHPLGFVTWLGWPIERYWTSIFIGWLAKAVVIRLIGFRGFRKIRPAAFGLILGMNVIFVVWVVAHMIWPTGVAIMID